MGSDTIQTLLYESRIEIKRLRARLLSEQKQRLDQFDFVKTYDAAKCKVEIDELKAINAELLAACEKALTCFPVTGDARFEPIAIQLSEAIKKANLATNHPKD